MDDASLKNGCLYPTAVHTVLQNTGIFIGSLLGASKSDFLKWITQVFANAKITLFSVTPQEASSYRSLTRSALPFHNDGVYLKWPPRYVALFCEDPGAGGGTTAFVRGDLVGQEINKMSSTLFVGLKENPVCTKLGDFSCVRGLIVKHPCFDADVLFFMDPSLAPDIASISFISNELLLDPDDVVSCIRKAISSQSKCLEKEWLKSDVVIFDNYLFLHARKRFFGARRLIRADIRYE